YPANTPVDGGAIIQGNVGIGTTAPGAKLDIQGGDVLISSSAPGVARIQLQGNNSDGVGYIGNPTNYSLQFFTNGIANPRMTIKNNGNVGIGTTGPGTKLHLHDGVFRVTTTSANTYLMQAF
ncbi:MAG: hypothetical protein CO035_04070, partial [Candidatus Omnitrophica bacterium CG_4_9_14_0_2_um_filter_42_8]